MDDQPDINKAITLPEPEGRATTWFLKGYWVRFVIQCLQSWLNTEYIIKQTDGTNILPPAYATVTTTKTGRTVVFNAITSSGGGSSNPQVFGGNGPPSATTLSAGNYVSGINPNCYVDKTNNAFYYCSTAGTASTSAWTLLSSASLTPFTISTINATTLTCTSAQTGTGNFTIYKPPELSGSLGSEVIDGETITYSNYVDSSNERTATDGTGNTELQYITPRYAVGAQIWAMPTLFNTGSSWTTVLMEISPSRQWGGIN